MFNKEVWYIFHFEIIIIDRLDKISPRPNIENDRTQNV